ncbi:MAG: FHA domain-containing protein [Verrucomicrobiota bacterium]
MQKLIIEDDEGRTTVVPLVRDELTIGRKEGNTIRLTERNVSRRHARLFKQNGAIAVEDFASYTGVRVNGVRITGTTPIRDGDQVQIGDYKLSVRAEAGPDAVPPTVPGLPMALADAASTAAIGATSAHQATATVGTEGAAHGRSGTVTQMDAAPTIPLRTLEEQGRAPQLPTAQSGRLVVVTTDLAGLEFRLDRASLVIGRTEENDIILNHASISRHHAKVVRDGDRYTVVDLQSANGVRVAGESYERVDVQPGDVVELGHVKLRFVGPWENWTFDAREFAPKSRRKLKIGAGVGGVVLAAILIVSLQGKKPPPPPPVVVAPTPAGPSAEQLFADASKAAEAEDWDKAVSGLDLLLGHGATDTSAASVKPQALELKRKVDLERRSAAIFASFEQAVSSNEPDVALSRFDELPVESVYKARAEPSLGGMKTLFLAAHIDLADSARIQGRCDEARAEVEKVQQVDPTNKQALDILRKCRFWGAAPRAALPPPAAAPHTPPAAAPTAVAAPVALRPAAPVPPAGAVAPTARPAVVARPVAPARTPAPRPARAPAGGTTNARSVVATNTTDSNPGAADGDDAPDAADLIKQAREAWMRQQCGSAIDLSRRALKLKPGANDAHQIIAVCACSMKDREGAIKSYSKLDERSRAMVRTLCARNGVELVE